MMYTLIVFSVVAAASKLVASDSTSSVPPSEDAADISYDVEAREGANVSLSCDTAELSVRTTWRREDGEVFKITPHGKDLTEYERDVLIIREVHRTHTGVYICSASNGVLPPQSKRTVLRVIFPPTIIIPIKLVPVALGEDVTLQCIVESSPLSINYWDKDNKVMLIGGKYNVTETVNSYKILMHLNIRKLGPDDFGEYKCSAVSAVGEADSYITIVETDLTVKIPTTASDGESSLP